MRLDEAIGDTQNRLFLIHDWLGGFSPFFANQARVALAVATVVLTIVMTALEPGRGRRPFRTDG
jgi:hypothetical protein